MGQKKCGAKERPDKKDKNYSHCTALDKKSDMASFIDLVSSDLFYSVFATLDIADAGRLSMTCSHLREEVPKMSANPAFTKKVDMKGPCDVATFVRSIKKSHRCVECGVRTTGVSQRGGGGKVWMCFECGRKCLLSRFEVRQAVRKRYGVDLPDGKWRKVWRHMAKVAPPAKRKHYDLYWPSDVKREIFSRIKVAPKLDL